MRVFHGRGDFRMTHEFLDGDEIDPEANKASGECMAKIVEAAAWNPGSSQRASERSLSVFDGLSVEAEHMADAGFRKADQRLQSRVVDVNVADSTTF